MCAVVLMFCRCLPRMLAAEFPDSVWYVDLAPLTNSVVIPVTVARTLGLPDQPGRSTMDTVLRFIGQKTMLLPRQL